MSTSCFLVSPDFNPTHTFDWYCLNSLFQRLLDMPLYLHLAWDYEDFHNIIVNKHPALVYASAFSATDLMKEGGYLPLARPHFVSDEVMIITHRKNATNSIEDISYEYPFVCLADVEVEKIGLMMLAAVDVRKKEVAWQSIAHFQSILRYLSEHSNSLGIVRADAFHALSPKVRRYYKTVVTSSVSFLFHVLLVSPECAKIRTTLSGHIDKINREKTTLAGLNMHKGLREMTKEQGLFLCDVVDAFL